MAASDVPAVSQGITDPSEWGLSGWLSDIVPHLIYGLVTASTYHVLAGSPPAAEAGTDPKPASRGTA